MHPNAARLKEDLSFEVHWNDSRFRSSPTSKIIKIYKGRQLNGRAFGSKRMIEKLSKNPQREPPLALCMKAPRKQ